MQNCCEKERRDVAFGKGLFDKREPLALFELALVLVHFDHRIHSFPIRVIGRNDVLGIACRDLHIQN